MHARFLTRNCARARRPSLGRENLALQATPVTDLMANDFITLKDTASVGEAMAQMARGRCAEAHLAMAMINGSENYALCVGQ